MLWKISSALACAACFASASSLPACQRPASALASEPAPQASRSAAVAVRAAPSAALLAASTLEPEKVDFQDVAMGTNVHVIAYTNAQADTAHVQAAIRAAVAEMGRLEGVLSEWRDDSDVGRINSNPEQWVGVGPEAFSVISRALAEGKASGGAFDITFQAMSSLWKFGSAADAQPILPTPSQVEQARKWVDYRTVELDSAARAVRIPEHHALGLGGIAKGYIVDRAASVLRQARVSSFLVQAGGDLLGAGRKPDGAPWVSGIQDPRAAPGVFFATIELTDHAFSTAGDYARSYVIGKRRYHHIIDPHTGYPATESRSVTIWAEDATTADAIDDAVFILGPEKGLRLVNATPGVGAVIVDRHNKLWVSPVLKDKLHVTRPPSDGI